MEIGKLRSIQMLKASGAMGDLSKLGAVVNLQQQYRDSASSRDRGGFANQLKTQGPEAARQLWEFLDGLPAMARATGHFHFATGIDDPWMSPAGSAAHAAAIKWSDVLSEAVDLVGYEFSELSNHRPDEAKATFDRMDGLLSDEIDGLIARRLFFFQTIKQPKKTDGNPPRG